MRFRGIEGALTVNRGHFPRHGHTPLNIRTYAQRCVSMPYEHVCCTCFLMCTQVSKHFSTCVRVCSCACVHVYRMALYLSICRVNSDRLTMPYGHTALLGTLHTCLHSMLSLYCNWDCLNHFTCIWPAVQTRLFTCVSLGVQTGLFTCV